MYRYTNELLFNIWKIGHNNDKHVKGNEKDVKLMDKEEQLLNEIRQVYNKIILLNKPIMEQELAGYTSGEVHCIQEIGRHAKPNVSDLSYNMFMTRGGISKLTKKLIDKDAIQRYQDEHNKKEVYFKLTDKGTAIFDKHESLHQQFRERDAEVFDQVTDEQYEVMLSFFEKYNQHLTEEIEGKGTQKNN